MKTVRLVFGTHNALPVGDYDYVFERVYQSSCVVPQWRIDLDPGVPWSLDLRLTVEAAGS